MRIFGLAIVAASVLIGTSAAQAACYPKALVDGLAADLSTAHGALVEDRGFYQVADVDALPANMQVGLSGQEVACPAPDQPPGPVSDTDAAADEVAEDAAAGTTVGYTANSVDPDGDVVAYSLSDDASGRFAIDANTGVVAVAAALDFETAASHQITVVATANALTSQATATITVLDVAEPPSTLPAGYVKIFEVSEHMADARLDGGHEIGTLSADKKIANGPVIFRHNPDFATAEGTIVYHVRKVSHKEVAEFSQRVNEAGALANPEWSQEQGGNSNAGSPSVFKFHIKRGVTEDESPNNGRPRHHMACQWNLITASWGGGLPTRFSMNGRIVSYEHSNTADQTLSDALFAWMVELTGQRSNGRYKARHVNRTGWIMEPLFFARRLTGEEIQNLHTSLYADLIAAGLHVPGQGEHMLAPPGFTIDDVPGRASGPDYDGSNWICDHHSTDFMPKSVDEVQFGAVDPGQGGATGGGGGTDVGEAPTDDSGQGGGGSVPTPPPATGPGLPLLAVHGDGLATFGMSFAPGDLPGGKGLALAGEPIQVDVKATHTDGSARHAIITAPPNTSPLGVVPPGQCDPLAAAASLPASGWSQRVAVNGSVFDVAAAVQADLAAGALDVFLTCPIASQYRVAKDLTPTLRVTADVTAYADGRIRTDIILDSGAAKNDQTLDVKISQDGALIYEAEQLHWPRTMWRTTIWRGEKPTAHPVRDPAYAIGTGATPRYDTSIEPNLSGPLDRAASVAAGVAPMASPLNKLNMAATGQTANRHIGLMTVDQVIYLLSQDPRILPAIEAYSDGAGSIGWHGPGGSTVKTGGWRVDEAHQPAFHYAAYLWTGDRYRLDLLHRQTEASIADRGSDLLKGQRRAVAWKVRNLANAAYVTPDDHPLKGYFVGHLTRTMEQWHRDYVLDGRGAAVSGEIRGFHLRCMSRKNDRGKTSPWMEDYITLVVGWLAEMRVPLAREVLAYRANFTLGRFESHPGWHPYQGAAYRLGVMDPETCKPSPNISRWADVWKAPEPRNDNGKPHRAGHYFDLAFGAVKTVDNVLQTERSAKVVSFMRAWQAAHGDKAATERRSNPKWAIAGGS